MPLFHYTDLNAVMSILKNRKLWLTDLRYLNDKTEFSHGIERLLKATGTAPYGLFCDFAKAPQAAEIVKSKLDEAGRHGVNLDPIYVCSLSRAENLLSQWRGYGQYAIEFDEAVLKQEVPFIMECVYDHKDQISMAFNAITDAIQKISKSIDDNGCMGELGYDALTHLLKLAATFKDDGFSEEREFRLVLDGERLNTKYRARNNLLIPYIELPISLDCIKSIHIGPMNERELAEKSLSGFCEQIQSDWQSESANIEYWLPVNTSTIPYRSI